MGKGLCCGPDKDLTYDKRMRPILVKRLNKNKSKSDSNHRVYCLEVKTEGKKFNCAHYYDKQQCIGDKQRIWDPKNFNVVHLRVLKGSEEGKKITIPMVLRKEDELASLKLFSATSTEMASNLSLKKNIEQRSLQYQDTEHPGNGIDLKTSCIPVEVATALSRWMKSEKIGRKAITEILERDAWVQEESNATGPVINHCSSTTSVISTQPRTLAPYLNKWYASRTKMDDGKFASESSDSNLEELPDFYGEDFFAYSETQLERKKCRSRRASKIFANLPPLSDALKDMTNDVWTYGNEEKVSPDQESLVSRGSDKISSSDSPGSMSLIMADIELLEQRIKEKTVTIKELREESVNILTTGYDSDLGYQSDGDTDNMSLWLNVEKKVNRLEDEKLDLLRKKDILVYQLQRLNYLKPDDLQNRLFTAQERPPNAKLEISDRLLTSGNNNSRISFRELGYEDSLDRPSFFEVCNGCWGG